MTTTFSNLQSDLVTEILTRVPLKYMRAVRMTCKNWNDLSKNQIFTKMHIDKAATTGKEGETQMIVMMGYNLHLTNIFINEDPSIKQESKLCCLNKQVKIFKFINCEGLLLCILKEDSRVVVWNPYLGQPRWIIPRYSHSPYRCDGFSYARGYEDKKNKSCRSHKLLRFLVYYVNPESDNHFLWYEIYDFDSDLWTTLDVVTPHFPHLYRSGVSLKGNTYWCAPKRNTDDEYGIICFDFTKERFGSLLPLPFSAGPNDYVTLSCVREEKLAVLLQHNEYNPYELDIWITTKIEDEEVLWSKFLRIETEWDICVPFISGNFFIDEENKVAIGFEEDNRHRVNIIGEAEYFRGLDLVGEFGDQNYMPHLCSYVPSLVQIKQPEQGGEWKQESDVEKRRYDQNMLRFVSHLKRMNKLCGGGKRQKKKNS
ncbi:F-box/kelch-repeat protein [Cardamine amara subsp. amara]|uniref:F-box/kelch-repeat protein n=1 Tax=Cardamine amara subsp. amara TaxID=228776 RepID=A0ABD0ZV78_CARAN